MILRILFILITGTAIVGAAMVIDQRSQLVEPPAEQAAPTVTHISAPGIVEGATENIELRPEAAGSVTELFVSIGDWAAPGQPLVRLDDRRERWQRSAAEAELALAKARLERLLNGARESEREEARALAEAARVRLRQAETTLARIEGLERSRAVAPQEADEERSRVNALRAELAAAEARVEQIQAPARDDEVRLAKARVAGAEAAVGLAQVAIDKTIIRAPCRGRVLDINAEVGELLSLDEPTPTVVLSDTSQMRVRAFVEEFDAPDVCDGALVEVTADGLPGRVFKGVVASSSPTMAEKRLFTGEPGELYDTKTREVLIDLEGAEELLVGMRVDVRIASESPASAASGSGDAPEARPSETDLSGAAAAAP